MGGKDSKRNPYPELFHFLMYLGAVKTGSDFCVQDFCVEQLFCHQVCDRRFGQIATLNQHRKKHEKEKHEPQKNGQEKEEQVLKTHRR